MDILYIVGEGLSKCDNQELRYSLRSIDKYGIGVDRVFVAGYCPEWLSDKVIKVPFKQPYDMSAEFSSPNEKLACKSANIIATVYHTIDTTDIGEEFLVSMDDHFYIRKTDFNNYPYYAKERMELPETGSTDYVKHMVCTRKYLESRGLDTYYLVPHRNMHCSRKILNECRNEANILIDKKAPIEYLCWLLNYQHTKYGFEIVPIADVKVRNGLWWNRVNPKFTEVFSTIDYGKNDRLATLVGELYPEMSKYEKQC